MKKEENPRDQMNTTKCPQPQRKNRIHGVLKKNKMVI